MFIAHEFRVAQAVPTPPKFLTRRCRRSEIICSPNAAATADNLRQARSDCSREVRVISNSTVRSAEQSTAVYLCIS